MNIKLSKFYTLFLSGLSTLLITSSMYGAGTLEKVRPKAPLLSRSSDDRLKSLLSPTHPFYASDSPLVKLFFLSFIPQFLTCVDQNYDTDDNEILATVKQTLDNMEHKELALEPLLTKKEDNNSSMLYFCLIDDPVFYHKIKLLILSSIKSAAKEACHYQTLFCWIKHTAIPDSSMAEVNTDLSTGQPIPDSLLVSYTKPLLPSSKPSISYADHQIKVSRMSIGMRTKELKEALKSKNVDIVYVQCLLNNQADPAAKTKSGKTCIDLANESIVGKPIIVMLETAVVERKKAAEATAQKKAEKAQQKEENRKKAAKEKADAEIRRAAKRNKMKELEAAEEKKRIEQAEEERKKIEEATLLKEKRQQEAKEKREKVQRDAERAEQERIKLEKETEEARNNTRAIGRRCNDILTGWRTRAQSKHAELIRLQAEERKRAIEAQQAEEKRRAEEERRLFEASERAEKERIEAEEKRYAKEIEARQRKEHEERERALALERQKQEDLDRAIQQKKKENEEKRRRAEAEIEARQKKQEEEKSLAMKKQERRRKLQEERKQRDAQIKAEIEPARISEKARRVQQLREMAQKRLALEQSIRMARGMPLVPFEDLSPSAEMQRFMQRAPQA